MEIKEVLAMLLAKERIEPAAKGYHLPGAYYCGKKRAATPDYWEYGVR